MISQIFVFAGLLLIGVYSESDVPDFYTFKVQDIHGEEVSLEKYRGSASLVVNVASLCGFTDTHYRALTRLQDILGYGGKFNVLAFPCNQFGDQEPYDNEVINVFARDNYKAEFPLFAKVEIIGENAHPAYKNLIDQSSIHPDWNFFKYLVDHNGHVLKAWGTKTTIEEIFNDIKAAIDAIPSSAQDTDAEQTKPTKEEL